VSTFFIRAGGAILAGAFLASCAAPQAVMPGTGGATSFGTSAPVALAVSQEDAEMARHAQVLSYHLMPLRRSGPDAVGDHKIVYPADLHYKGGPLMTAAASFNVYVNCKGGGESCWGDPEGFQKRLTGSTFAQLLTQYTKSPPTAYTLGGTFSVKYSTYTKLYYQNDLLTVLHAALAQNGRKAGYANLYHVFLPKGSDTCFDRSTACYSPDHAKKFNFCAYHESVSFPDISEPVIVSIEPYQMVSFCASRASRGASALTNSTVSTLGHETFESITDPGPRLAWYNFTYNSEVADLCETYQWKIGIGGTQYSIQPMYSNTYHACAAGP
jgi:hypothetical protein